MKRLIMALCVLSLLSLVGWTSYGQKASSTKTTWEYFVRWEGGAANQRADLAALGAEGWELVAVTTGEEAIGEQRYGVTTYYFKRRK